MDPSLVLTSEQKANRFTKHNMRKEVIHQELVDPDDQNISEHKEDETSETLNVVDINPIPQYDTDNANFDLHLSTTVIIFLHHVPCKSAIGNPRGQTETSLGQQK